jgi:hypothetical protein
MKKISFVLIAFMNLNAIAQENPTQLAMPIVAEGKRLFKSEMASWYGTDVFVELFKDQSKIGGYFSYSDNDTSKCIFFSKGENPKVIGTISFDSTYDTKKAGVDLTERDFSFFEYDLYSIRKLGIAMINSDTLFKTYKNTNLNLIPVISNNERKVYVLTGPTQNGVVIFGNDYLIVFDPQNNILSKKQLHKNIIPIKYGGEQTNDDQIEGTIHSHLPETGDFITATDICTLMLYEKFAKWKQHNVVSAKYLNIWNCESNQLTVIPMETVDKIDKDQEKRKKKH